MVRHDKPMAKYQGAMNDAEEANESLVDEEHVITFDYQNQIPEIIEAEDSTNEEQNLHPLASNLTINRASTRSLGDNDTKRDSYFMQNDNASDDIEANSQPKRVA